MSSFKNKASILYGMSLLSDRNHFREWACDWGISAPISSSLGYTSRRGLQQARFRSQSGITTGRAQNSHHNCHRILCMPNSRLMYIYDVASRIPLTTSNYGPVAWFLCWACNGAAERVAMQKLLIHQFVYCVYQTIEYSYVRVSVWNMDSKFCCLLSFPETV